LSFFPQRKANLTVCHAGLPVWVYN
jgi:hypothetical protein